MRSYLPLPPCLLLIVLVVSACAGDREPRWPEDDELVVGLDNAPTHLDPRVGTDQASGAVFQLVFNGLVTQDETGVLLPDLAASWQILDGGRRYRFHLRAGVRFHDGSELDAQDVLWTFRSILDGTVKSAKRGAFTRLVGVESSRPLEVDFVLDEPFGALLVNLTSFTGIVPAGATVEQMAKHPIGTGPFRFLSRTPEKVTLGAFAEYFGGSPPLRRVVLREVPDATVRALELQKGSVQLLVNGLAPDVIPLFRRNSHYRVEESPAASFAYLGFNLRDPLLADVRVRRALGMAIDRQTLVDTLWRGLGVVSETILPPGHWARHDGLAPLPFDPVAAGELLDAAGHTDPDGSGPLPRFRLTYKTSTSEPYLLQAQIIQQMLAGLGVELEIRSYEFATFYADVSRGNFQIFSLNRFGVVDPDIFTLLLHSAMVPPQGQNRGFYSDAEFDRAVEEGVRRLEPEERRPYYLRAQEIFARDLPYLVLHNRVNAAVVPANLLGYRNYPSGELYSLRSAYWVR